MQALLIFVAFFLTLTARMRADTENFRTIDDRIRVDVFRLSGGNEHYETGSVEALHKGDRFVVRADGISDIRPGSALVFSIYNSEVKVYSDDHLLYADDYSAKEESESVGDRWYAVSIPDDASQNLRVEGTIVRNGSISLFSGFRILPSTAAWKSIISGNEFIFLLFSAVDVFSCVFLAFFAVTSFQERRIRMGVWIALFSIVICNWYLGYKLFFYIISDDAALNANIEYISFFSIGMPFAFFMHHHLHKNLLKKISRWIGMFFAAVLLISTVINYSPLHMNYCDLLPACRILLGISLIYFGYAVFRDENEDSTEDALANRIIKWGVIIALCVGIFSLISAQLNAAHVTQSLKAAQIDPVSLAILSVVTALYVSVLSRYAHETMSRFEAEQLKTIAFIDPLTGAENRAALYSHLNELNLRHRKDYAIVFLDVNGLKQTNDKYGHAMGDELIASAGQLVRQSFREGERGFAGRWGGDEFLACVYGSAEDAKTCIRRFYANLDAFNAAKRLPFPMSVSSGYAVSTSADPVDYETLIKQADPAMYSDKKAYKEGHGLGAVRA